MNPESWLVSTGIVALAEVGDKTQLLSLVLAARFRKPWPILLGILLATLLNHSLAAALGVWITTALSREILAWILGSSFILMAFWMLIPDTCDEEAAHYGRYGVFVATLLAFFLAEMGDKTQIATIALAARYDALGGVVAGTTLGMMIANAPMVFLGEKLAHRLPVRPIHRLAALIFLILGGVVLGETGESGRQVLAFLAGLIPPEGWSALKAGFNP
ncbi:TMEM165/GDT1 family protein [Candidatus Woesearchaeota archaeon]|jgi:putative Ca2+/H+ antiporter (TMEM165/GDT1 family)|nr:TMEM165/GDT1 family protein [Candidatus Woesearchaeota archaeon]